MIKKQTIKFSEKTPIQILPRRKQPLLENNQNLLQIVGRIDTVHECCRSPSKEQTNEAALSDLPLMNGMPC